MQVEASSVRASTSRSLHLPPRAQYLPAACICVSQQQNVCVWETIYVGTLVFVFEDWWLSPPQTPAGLTLCIAVDR